MKRIFIYCNPSIYGGHGVMTVNAVNALLESGKYKINITVYKNNTPLINALVELKNSKNLSITKLHFSNPYFEDILAPFFQTKN